MTLVLQALDWNAEFLIALVVFLGLGILLSKIEKNRAGFRLLRLGCLLLMVYCCLEVWARVRFFANNPTLPADIRKNIGMNRLEASRLVPGYQGYSPSGIYYETDQYGFRKGKGAPVEGASRLLLGGDSRIFGLGLEHQRTPAGALEKRGWGVYQQAIPAGSPLLFRRQMLDRGLINRLDPKPERLVYAMEWGDIYDDMEFHSEEGGSKTRRFFRRLKIVAGGYFYAMLKVKIRAFVMKAEVFDSDRKDKTSKKAAPEKEESLPPPKQKPMVPELTRESLRAIAAEADRRGIRPEFVYLPDYSELKEGDFSKYESCNELAKSVGFEITHPLMPAMLESGKDPAVFYLDEREGMHLSAEASALIGKLLTGEDKP